MIRTSVRTVLLSVSALLIASTASAQIVQSVNGGAGLFFRAGTTAASPATCWWPTSTQPDVFGYPGITASLEFDGHGGHPATG